MRLFYLFCILFIFNVSHLCEAGLARKLTRPFMRTSKDVKMNPARAVTDYDTQIAHHTKEQLAHSKKTEGFFRTKSNIAGHQRLAEEHSQAAQRARLEKDYNSPVNNAGKS